VSSFEGLTQDRQPDELWCAGNFMAWFVHEDDDLVRWEAWADLWKLVLYFANDREFLADGQQWATRPGPAPGMTWRWLAGAAAFAAGEGNVRLPSQILACVLYWELIEWELLDSSYGRPDGLPMLRPPVAASRIKATLCGIALRCLLLLPAGEGLLYKQGRVWTAAQLATFAANEVNTLGARYGLLTRELAALVRDTLGGQGGHAHWWPGHPPHLGSLLSQPFGSSLTGSGRAPGCQESWFPR
jgi:hypothetical protein